ncbi:hydrogenase formation protein HypD [candidate division KSB1 bacterium]|nr:hydrogenase formation protein HypD [candidate division KSB1 bacterium]
MTYQNAFRDPETVQRLLQSLDDVTTRKWSVMEICGGQTHVFLKYGLDRLLPKSISLLHGPGCPVCVTGVEWIDAAVALANRSDITLLSFGDMLRVPGSETDLLSAKSAGASVNMVYSPMDALTWAEAHPAKQAVFFAVGFETTAPAVAWTIEQAEKRNAQNFSVLCAHVRVPPAIQLLLSHPDHRIDGFLAAGHVCTIMGCKEYEIIASRFQLPIVVTGFEPLDLLYGLYRCVVRLEEKNFGVENAYSRVARDPGNSHAQQKLTQIFEIVNRNWRGLGTIPQSGLAIRERYRHFDAKWRFADSLSPRPEQSEICPSGRILQGLLRPDQCPYFGVSCTPENPLGAPMVSSEGACAAYFRYRRKK